MKGLLFISFLECFVFYSVGRAEYPIAYDHGRRGTGQKDEIRSEIYIVRGISDHPKHEYGVEEEMKDTPHGQEALSNDR